MKYTAILIDDEAWTRDVLRGLGAWDKLGIEIIAEASDGEYGLELISRLQPDILITDVRMPHMDGIELLKSLRRQGNRAKVIFVSGHDDFEYIRGAMKLKAMDYLLKPVKPDELNEQLSRCVKELDAKESDEVLQNLDLQGFMNVDWVREYKSLQNSVYESLRSDDPGLLPVRFRALFDFICSQRVSSLSRSLEICIYFDLHNLLQRYIWESGYTLSEVFGEKARSFVFSNDFSMKDMLGYVQALFCEAQKRIADLVRSKNRLDVGKVKQYMDANYLNGITLEETAARFYVSKEYLSKLFKQQYDISFSDYVTGLKMGKARSLLIADRIAIKEIAHMTGYADLSHFYKAFKKYYGVTPGEMLSEIKN